MAAEPPKCSGLTQDGAPCKHAPMALAGGRCHHHAGLATTDAEKAASQQNALKTGFFSPRLLNEEERQIYERGASTNDLVAVKRDLLGLALVNLNRVALWETEKNSLRR
jgi:hypothetical protein